MDSPKPRITAEVGEPLRVRGCECTARRFQADPRLPLQRKATRGLGRTMLDPLEAVWEPVLLPILERDPAVQAVTLLRHLQLTNPEAFPDNRVCRTLERRVRDWRALHGPERNVIFRQTPERVAWPCRALPTHASWV